MSRTVSSTAKQAVFAAQTGQVFLVLLEISHADFASTIRLVNNTESVTHGGNTYSPFPFQIELPSDRAEQIDQVRLTVDNIDRSIIQELRNISSAPDITFKVVLASSPNTVEAGPFEMSLRDITYNALTIQGTLGYEPIVDEPFPGDSFTPQNHPGLF